MSDEEYPQVYRHTVCPVPGCGGKLNANHTDDILAAAFEEGVYIHPEFDNARYDAFCPKCRTMVCNSVHPRIPVKCRSRREHGEKHAFTVSW